MIFHQAWILLFSGTTVYFSLSLSLSLSLSSISLFLLLTFKLFQPYLYLFGKKGWYLTSHKFYLFTGHNCILFFVLISISFSSHFHFFPSQSLLLSPYLYLSGKKEWYFTRHKFYFFLDTTVYYSLFLSLSISLLFLSFSLSISVTFSLSSSFC